MGLTPKAKKHEAERWDSIDVSKLDPADVEVLGIAPSGPLAATVAIRLDAATMTAIRRIAKGRKIGYTSLLRTWIIERLATETAGNSLDAEVRSRVSRAVAARIPLLIDEATEKVLRELDEEP